MMGKIMVFDLFFLLVDVDAVIEIDAVNVKALFRRGCAHLARGRDVDLAVIDLQSASSLAPKDAAIQAK